MNFTESRQDCFHSSFSFTDQTDRVGGPRNTGHPWKAGVLAARNRTRLESAGIKWVSTKRNAKCLTESKRGIALGCQNLGPGGTLGLVGAFLLAAHPSPALLLGEWPSLRQVGNTHIHLS